MLDFHRATVLTFDCYGTLIDWEAGILRALRSVVDPRGLAISDDDLLRRFARVESPIQQGPFLNYRTVLDRGLVALCRDLGFEPTLAETTALSDSLPSWPPFPDTVPALRRLAERFRLGIISNVDDDLFAGSARLLEVPFDWIVTAQQVGSYKPAVANFKRALERIGRPRAEIVHCAQSLFHDVGPAQSLGLATVWVDRRGGKPGGATPPSAAVPDLTVPDLATLARVATER
ncbi:MAG: haloacid dehalogenase type II [Gemmatimonadales bacterium]